MADELSYTRHTECTPKKKELPDITRYYPQIIRELPAPSRQKILMPMSPRGARRKGEAARVLKCVNQGYGGQGGVHGDVVFVD